MRAEGLLLLAVLAGGAKAQDLLTQSIEGHAEVSRAWLNSAIARLNSKAAHVQ